MKNFTIFVAIVLFSSCVTSQFLDPTDDEKLHWSGNAHASSPTHKAHAPSPTHKAHAPSPTHKTHAPSPSHKHNPNRELKKCFSSYEMVTKCLMKTLTKNPTIGSECCATIEKLNENCKHTIFRSFRNPFVNHYVKKHCSSHDATALTQA